MPYCKACLTEYDNNIRFCKVCGSKLVLNGGNNIILSNHALTTQRSDMDQNSDAEKVITFDNAKQTFNEQSSPFPTNINTSIVLNQDYTLVKSEIKFKSSDNNLQAQAEKNSKKEISSFDQANLLNLKTEQSPLDTNSKLPFLKSFYELIAKTILNMSVLKPLAIIIFSFFIITGGYWSYIKYLSVNNNPVIPTPVKSHQEVIIQSQTPNQVFEIIRKANITKDIDLFMSCFSPKFKSLDNKKASRLKIWNKYDYNLLKYNIKGFIVLKDKASGLVEWEFYAQHKNTDKNFSTTTLYNVVLEKDSRGAWKILCLAKL